MFSGKTALLLDMNGTFMFGQDRFGDTEDYSLHYRSLGGSLPKAEINGLIRAIYQYLYARYIDENYWDCFPTVEAAIGEVMDGVLPHDEIGKIVATFAFHELGYVPEGYALALYALSRHFTLAAVTDIWSPKPAWLNEFTRAGITNLFSCISFSSDHGRVKPSPVPFQRVLAHLGIAYSEVVMIGDSPHRDLQGANSAGIACILVGGAKHPNALTTFNNLLELSDALTAQQQ